MTDRSGGGGGPPGRRVWQRLQIDSQADGNNQQLNNDANHEHQHQPDQRNAHSNPSFRVPGSGHPRGAGGGAGPRPVSIHPPTAPRDPFASGFVDRRHDGIINHSGRGRGGGSSRGGRGAPGRNRALMNRVQPPRASVRDLSSTTRLNNNRPPLRPFRGGNTQGNRGGGRGQSDRGGNNHGAGQSRQKMKGPKTMKAIHKSRANALTYLKQMLANDASISNITLEDVVKRIESDKEPPLENAAPIYVSYKEVVEQMINELNQDIERSKGKKQKDLFSASVPFAALAQTTLVDAKLNKTYKNSNRAMQLRCAVHFFTLAICKLPKAEIPGSQEANSQPKQNKLNNQAYIDLYRGRAEAYLLLGHDGHFWQDATVVLALTDHTHRMTLLKTVISYCIDKMKRNPPPLRGHNMKANKQWQDMQRREFNNGLKYLMLQAILDQQNDSKLSRLTKAYKKMNELQKTRALVDEVLSKPKAKDNNQNAPAPLVPPSTNITDNVDINPDTFLLTVKTDRTFKRNQMVFYEPVLTFKSGPGAGNIRFCSFCFRAIDPCRAVPCSVCSIAIFCSDKCQALAKIQDKKYRSLGRHWYECGIFHQVLDRTGSRSAYLAYRLLCSAGYYFRWMLSCVEGNKLKTIFDGSDPLTQNQESSDSNVEAKVFWPSFAVICSFFKHFQQHIVIEKKNANLLGEAIYLSYVFVEMSSKDSGIDQIQFNSHLLSLVYSVLLFVHYDPLAHADLKSTLARRSVAGRRRADGSYGWALGPFGSMLKYSCKPNLCRKYNPKKGRLEYVALKDLSPNEPLSIGWGLKMREMYKKLHKQRKETPNVTLEEVLHKAIAEKFNPNHDDCESCSIEK